MAIRYCLQLCAIFFIFVSIHKLLCIGVTLTQHPRFRFTAPVLKHLSERKMVVICSPPDSGKWGLKALVAWQMLMLLKPTPILCLNGKKVSSGLAIPNRWYSAFWKQYN